MVDDDGYAPSLIACKATVLTITTNRPIMSGAALTNDGEAVDPDATILFLDTCRKPRGGIVNTSLNSSTHSSS